MFKGLFFFMKNGWKYDKRYILWNIFCQLASAPIPAVTAFFTKLIIDEMLTYKRTNQLLLYSLTFAGIIAVLEILTVFFRTDGFSRRCNAAAEFDLDLHKRLYRCDYENLERPRFLELQEKSKKFLYCNQHGFGYLLDCALNIFGHCITLLGIAAMIYTLNVRLILLFILLAILGAVIDSIVQKRIKRLEDSVIDDQRRWSYYAGLFEKYEYGKEFRLYQAGEWLLSKEKEFLTGCNNVLYRQNNERIKSGIITAMFTFAQQLAAYGYLIGCAANDSITVGSFTMYVGAVTAFSVSVRQIVKSIVEIQSYDMYYDDLEEYLSVESTMRTGKKRVPYHISHTVVFENVSFRYPDSSRFILKNINITIKPGEKLLVVGENGAGKSTFIKLLLRLYDPTEGRILLDGTDIRELDYDCYHSLFSTVFQDFHLYSFSVKENIAMSHMPNDNEVTKILDKVGLGERIRNTAHGPDTPIHKEFDENGFEPSGGEGQRLAIARALYRNAPFIILDEPTAALDPRAEYEVYSRFSDMTSGKTAVYISHRLNSARFCDTIAVFENGCITEYGTHRDLIAKNGKYAELYSLQAEFYTDAKYRYT